MRTLTDWWQLLRKTHARFLSREADIYWILKRESVKYVASMCLGGDVNRLETETQKWVTELSPESKRLKRKMVGHRINLDSVVRDLSMLTKSCYPVLPM